VVIIIIIIIIIIITRTEHSSAVNCSAASATDQLSFDYQPLQLTGVIITADCLTLTHFLFVSKHSI